MTRPTLRPADRLHLLIWQQYPSVDGWHRRVACLGVTEGMSINSLGTMWRVTEDNVAWHVEDLLGNLPDQLIHAQMTAVAA